MLPADRRYALTVLCFLRDEGYSWLEVEDLTEENKIRPAEALRVVREMRDRGELEHALELIYARMINL